VVCGGLRWSAVVCGGLRFLDLPLPDIVDRLCRKDEFCNMDSYHE